LAKGSETSRRKARSSLIGLTSPQKGEGIAKGRETSRRKARSSLIISLI